MSLPGGWKGGAPVEKEIEMILCAEDFIRLRTREVKAEYNRAAQEAAPMDVWLEIVSTYPRMRVWVAKNKTIPMKVPHCLAGDKTRK